MKYQAFISCNPADRDLADAVKAALTDAGLACVCKEDLPHSEEDHKALVEAITRSKTMVFIPPVGYGADSTIHSEVETAVKLKRTVIPYYRRRAELDDSLRFLTQTSEPIWADEDDDALDRVVEAVRAAKEPPKPRKKTALIIAVVAAVILIAAGALLFTLLRHPEPTAVGQDGDNTWSFYEGSGKLIISGTGSGLEYGYFEGLFDGDKAPWYDYKDAVRTIIVEEGVTQIGYGAFVDMSNLEEITLPGTIPFLSSQILYRCPKLRELIIPEGVEMINSGVAFQCDALEKVSIPASAYRINGAVCELCSSLTEIELSPDNKNYKLENGVLYTADRTALVQYPTGSGAASYSMPDTVETVMTGSLMYCKSLETIEFSDNLRNIEYYALANSSVTEAILPEGLTDLDSGAFSGCDKLSRVQLPDSLTRIADFAFFGCSALKEVTIPASVTEIGGAAFGYGEDEKGNYEYYNITIKGEAGSAAEDYAAQYHCTFEAVN